MKQKKIEPLNPIDWFDPAVVIALTSAFIADLSFILALGVVIPVVGLVFLAFAIGGRLIGGIIAAAIIWGKTQGWIPKLVLLITTLQPIPFPFPVITLGVFLAIILSNKAIAFITEQVAIQAVAIFTGGAGEALEAGAVAGAGAEGAAATAQAARGAATAAQAARAGEMGTAERAVSAAERGVKPVTDKFEKIIKLKNRLQDILPPEQKREEDEEDDEFREAA